jgi:myo-inositol-1(or 4)-monophosphatase
MNTILDVAISAAYEAGKLVLSKFGKSEISYKGSSNNLVTDADRASERLIAKMIADKFPQASILGEEEHTLKDINAEELWIVDPIDGTTNYAHGIPQFSISIGYSQFGKVMAGVVYDPNRDELFAAKRGSGASLNGTKINVSSNKTLQESIIATGFYYDRGELLDNTLRAIYHLFKGNIQCVRRMGSAALDLCWVACGRFDAYYEYMLSPWDFAAGTLILEEAGGVWTDREGVENGLNSKGILCSNSWLQKDFLSKVSYSIVNAENNRIGL